MAELNEKFVVEINKSLNRLYCTVIGTVAKDDLEGIFASVAEAVSQLKPNFSLVNDLTQCKYGQITGIPGLQKVMQYLVSHGVREIVRVVNDKSVIHTQFNNLSQKYQTYVPVYVNSLEEADKFLQDQASRKYLRFQLFNKPVEIECKGEVYQGVLLDLSIGGGAIRCDIEPLAVDDEVKVTFSLPDNQGKDNQFVMKTAVIRIFDDSFSVDFKSMMPSVLSKLKECLALSIVKERK